MTLPIFPIAFVTPALSATLASERETVIPPAMPSAGVVTDTYVGPDRRSPQAVLRSVIHPFGDDVGPTATGEGFNAISTGRDAQRWLAMLEEGKLDLLKSSLEQAIEIGYAWEELAGINPTKK